MKILWLSHLVPYPPKGGVLQRSYNLVRETCKYHDVTLIAFIQKDLIKSRLSSLESGLNEAKSYLDTYCDYVEFVDIPSENSRFGKYLLAFKSLFTKDPYSINWLKSEQLHIILNKITDVNNFDLVHFDTISLAPYLNHFQNITKALDHHNIESHMMIRRAELENNILKRLYYYQEGYKLLKYEKKYCPQFDIQITCSDLDSKRLQEIIPNINAVDIPNGVDIDYFYPQSENEEPKQLIFAGSMSWYPNKDAMFYFSRKIWPLLKIKDKGFVMNVVGSSPPDELINLSNNDKNFKVHGFVDDVRDYISRASIYVCPISDGGGTKLKILDAFAMGIATVAHPMACEGIDVIDGVNVVFAETPEEFVEKIIELDKDDKLRQSISKNARKTVVDKYAYLAIGQSLSEKYIQINQNIS